MKKAKIVKAPDGLYEVQYPDGTKKWCYDKDSAEFHRDKFNQKLAK